MATFSTWAALETTLLDKIATFVAGNPLTQEYEITGPNGFRAKYRTIDDIKKLLEFVRFMKTADSHGTPQTSVSYGRYRRFQ